MKALIDLHTHTISSGHAYSSLQENIHQASIKGLKYYGMSDHAPGIPGGTHFFHFKNLVVIPNKIEGVRVLKGCELNIIDINGTVDLDDKTLKDLDYTIASFHTPCYSTTHTLEENMQAYEGACRNTQILIIGHPDDNRYPCDFDQLAKLCKKSNKIIEINNSSLKPTATRVNGPENCRKILEACKKEKCLIVLSSDAHISFDVGNFEYAEKLLIECDFPNELVLNYNENLIKEMLHLK